jgi:uncharacterized protein
MVYLVICDSSPLIHLSRNNLLFILEKLYKNIRIPNSVYREVFILGRNKPGYTSLKNAKWIQSEFVNNTILLSIWNSVPGLHDGEREVIALAEEHRSESPLVIIDDYEARDWAKNLNSFTVKTTLEVLFEAEKNNLIKSTCSELNKLIINGFTINKSVYRQYCS